jgi:hypothetical protein
MSAVVFLAPGVPRSSAGQAVAKAAIRLLTGREAVLSTRAGGAPVVRWAAASHDDPPALSISYCAEWVGVAVAARGRVGLDLEPQDSVAERVALRVMSATDAKRFRSLCPEERRRVATHYWTCAEALAKASGRGLPLMLTRAMTLGFAGEGSWEGYVFAAREVGDGLVCALAHDDCGADPGPRAASPTLLDLTETEELSVQSLSSIRPLFN